MRIISGALGGRKIHPPSRMPYTRPTTDVAKEGLFNILEHQFTLEDICCLDLFGGTGAISYELASRGAAQLTVVEKDPDMAAFIRKTAASLQLHQLNVVRSDVFRYIEQCRESYDFIFAGPPYALESIERLPDKVFERDLLRPKGLFVLEHTPRNNFTDHPHCSARRNYGTTVFSFFVNHPDPEKNG